MAEEDQIDEWEDQVDEWEMVVERRLSQPSSHPWLSD